MRSEQLAGERIKAFMDAQKDKKGQSAPWTVRKMAERTGVSAATISNVVSHATISLSYQSAVRIAKVMRVDPIYLMKPRSDRRERGQKCT